MALLRSGLLVAVYLSTIPVLAQPVFVDATDRLPTWTFPSNSMDVEAADLDGDGTLDLVVANEFYPNVLLLNDGTGTFTNAASQLPDPPGIIPGNFPSRDTEDIAVADLDGNGTLDLVLVSEDDINFGGSGVHEVYVRNTDGTYSAVPDALPDSEANAVAHADLTGDGRPDLLLGNDGQDLLLINDGTGAFVDETDTRLPAESRTNQDVEFALLNDDAFLDIVVGNENGNRLLINDGTGVFTDETDTRFPTAPPMETRKVTPGDVDGDGDLDLFFANVGWSGLSPRDRLFISDGDGTFTDGTDRLPASTLTSLDGKLADLDGDDDLDLIVVGVTVTSGLEPAPVEVYRNDGTGTFERADDLLADAPVLVSGLGIEVADFNDDGFPDVYFADRGAQDRLFLHTGMSTTTGEAAQPVTLPSLDPVAPNPVRGTAQFRYHLARAETATLAVFDTLGRRVATLASGLHPTGTHTARWDGNKAPAGFYLVRLDTAQGSSTRAFTSLH